MELHLLYIYGTQLERCIQNLSELTYSSVAEHVHCERIKSWKRNNKIIKLCIFLYHNIVSTRVGGAAVRVLVNCDVIIGKVSRVWQSVTRGRGALKIAAKGVTWLLHGPQQCNFSLGHRASPCLAALLAVILPLRLSIDMRQSLRWWTLPSTASAPPHFSYRSSLFRSCRDLGQVKVKIKVVTPMEHGTVSHTALCRRLTEYIVAPPSAFSRILHFGGVSVES